MILKSIGGKAQQIVELLTLLPPDIQTYYEPFAGSLALYWALKRACLITRAVVNDMNPLLADVYQVAKNDTHGLVAALDQMRPQRGQEVFAAYRNDLNGCKLPQSSFGGRLMLTQVERAARTIYLNRRGFNGLFRVNQSGELNMPWGADSALTSAEKILEAGRLLQGTEILSGDFESAVKGAGEGDFIFADPPYIGTFSGYAGTFGLREHRRLERVLAALDGAGVRWLVCNSEAPEVRQIWRKWELRQVYCRRNGNSNGKGRGAVPELRISNYEVLS